MALTPASPDGIIIEASGPGTELLTVTQTAALLNCTARSLEKYWKRDAGPARTRIGGRIFISRANLVAWVDSRTDPASRSPETHQPTPSHSAAA